VLRQWNLRTNDDHSSSLPVSHSMKIRVVSEMRFSVLANMKKSRRAGRDIKFIVSVVFRLKTVTAR
jgi:hypothetical protein